MKRRTKSERLAHLGQWRDSGLSRRDYCQQQGLNYNTFLSWSKLESPAEPRDSFVALPLADNISQNQILIRFPNGIELECRCGLTSALLEQLRDA
jgi:hypothetical protein